jgi:hypothetical protein
MMEFPVVSLTPRILVWLTGDWGSLPTDAIAAIGEQSAIQAQVAAAVAAGTSVPFMAHGALGENAIPQNFINIYLQFLQQYHSTYRM